LSWSMQNFGNAMSILAIDRVGFAIAYPIMQCGLFVSGVWVRTRLRRRLHPLGPCRRVLVECAAPLRAMDGHPHCGGPFPAELVCMRRRWRAASSAFDCQLGGIVATKMNGMRILRVDAKWGPNCPILHAEWDQLYPIAFGDVASRVGWEIGPLWGRLKFGPVDRRCGAVSPGRGSFYSRS
jgi:hypothetical protein